MFKEQGIPANIIAFIRKYKILHILFWTWSYIDLIHLQQQSGSTFNAALRISFLFKVGQIVTVYFVVYYLMPRYLRKGRYLQFILLIILSVLGGGIFTILLQEVEKLIFFGRLMRSAAIPVLFIGHIVELVMVTGFFFAVYTIQDMLATEKRNRILEKERLETELNFLKAQINPHFLFNTINSVYVLIEEDKKLASQTLLKFSGMLRYQLYDCNNDHMPLERETEFLRDYVDLERLRSGDNLDIRFEMEAANEPLEIAPFILIPFVENAFKHRSHRRRGNIVHIRASVTGNNFQFNVTNTFDDEPATTVPKQAGGIGLKNVQRRLELLYPGRYNLVINKNRDLYSVDLQLELNEIAMHIGR